MQFQSVLSFAHILSLAVAISAFFVLLRQLGMRTLSENSRRAICFNIRITSYAMLLGIFLVCLSAGALIAYGLLTTSQLPALPLLAIRIASLTGVVCCAIFLHVQAMPMLREAQGRRIVDAVSASRIMACALAASLAILGWSMWILSGTHPAELQTIRLGTMVPASALTISLLWLILTVSLLGERGYRELKALALDIKKRLTPPTPIERQRAARARRMHSMNLPMAPRRRAAA